MEHAARHAKLAHSVLHLLNIEPETMVWGDEAQAIVGTASRVKFESIVIWARAA